jgi:hypothetical protein
MNGMSDDADTMQNLTETAAESNDLNAISQPLGYAVTYTAGGSLGNDAQPDYRRFTVHRIDKPVASGPSFDTAKDVRAHLEQVVNLPVWRLDLDDPSVEFDNTELSVKDTATDDSFSLRGWGLGVTGVAQNGQAAGRYEGAKHLSVRSDVPPTIGKWYKSDVG